MGAWSVSINGNDTAQDLRPEYSVAFSRHEPEVAVALLDAFVRREWHSEPCDDDGDWVDYRYSLADYMWKKGVLTPAIRDEVIAMIDRGAGLSLYDHVPTLRKREKVLAVFREQLLSPQPPRKPIRLSGVQTKPLFDIGDVIAMQLDTTVAEFEGNPYRPRIPFTEAAFRAFNGMWIAMRKIGDKISWRSAVDSEVRNLWPVFQLYKGVFSVCPTVEDLSRLPFARVPDEKRFVPLVNDCIFSSNNTRTGYRRRNAQVIGQDFNGLAEAASFIELLERNPRAGQIENVFIDVFHPHTSSDLELVQMLLQR